MKRFALCSFALFTLVCSAPAQDSAARGWAGAQWVWDQAGANETTQTDDPRYLRTVFNLAAKPVKAELWITVDNKYTVYVNGKLVGADSEWNTIEKYDVAPLLVPGKNVLGIVAQNQGAVAGAIARLHVQTADKKDHFIVTNERFKITQAAAKDWLKTDFNDSSWFAAIVLGDTDIGPWNLAGSFVAQGGGKGAKDYNAAAVDPKVTTRLTPQQQLKHFVFPEGFQVELVAADPIVINPITMSTDDKGRIYVSESHTYRYGPSGSPIKPFANPVVRLDPTPDGKGFKRTLVADGFADPVMGIAIKGDKLWLTACDYLYQYDLLESPRSEKEGIAVNKKLILKDKTKAWNPFGMFVLEWGPDGLLYMSVGDHNIDIHGPDGKIGGRRNSGIIMRMNSDGTKMQRLTHGFRVPYSFEYDPFGQLWLLSNGEGNPNRFARVLDGVDYHCYSRPGVDNSWLAGNNRLAPPVFELHRGANTQLMRYYGADFPAEYQGNLFLCNWGAHGFAGSNRGIFRFVPDEHNNIVHREPLLACTDPHFRPSHILLDTDGSLLVADWYGRDDESDMTGRIWRLKYVGKNRPQLTYKLDSAEWAKDEYAVNALSSTHHLIRQKVVDELIKRGPKVVGKLAEHAAQAKEPLGAAYALWALLRLDTPESKASIASGAKHADWKVRRLAVNILRRYELPAATVVAKQLSEDKDAAVRVEAALAQPNSDAIASNLVSALINGAAADEHLRYEAAWHLAKNASLESLAKVLGSDDADVRLAGLIAIDVACFEEFPTKKIALVSLGRLLENPGKIDLMQLLTLAQMHGDGSIIGSLEKMVAREDLPIAATAKAILVLKTKAPGGLSKSLGAAAGKRLVEAVEKGAFKIASPADQLTLFEFLESEGPTPFALKQVGSQLRSNQPVLREMAHVLARKFGVKGAPLANDLWASVMAPKTNFNDAVEQLSTLARIENAPRKEAWEKLLSNADPLLRAEAVRWWRNFKGDSALVDVLVRQAPELAKNDEGIKEDLGSVLRHLNQPEAIKALGLPDAEKDKAALTKYVQAELAKMPDAAKKKRTQLGLQVFERNACTKCHTTATRTTPLAPSLKGIAAQKIDYLIESVLFPSKIIKTGFESESIVLNNGKVISGLVKDDGKFLRVLNLDAELRISKSDIESRAVTRISIMPEGQEALLSRRELVDLIAYLTTLK